MKKIFHGYWSDNSKTGSLILIYFRDRRFLIWQNLGGGQLHPPVPTALSIRWWIDATRPAFLLQSSVTSLLQLADLQKPYFFPFFFSIFFFRNKKGKGNIDFNLNRWLKWQIANDKWSQTTHVDGYYQIAIQIDPGLYNSYIMRRPQKYDEISQSLSIGD